MDKLKTTMLVLAFAPTLMNAQTFFTVGTSWKTELWNIEPDPKIYIQIVSLDGTETIDGYTSMKMYSEYDIIAKTICTNFQNEMCIFLYFFAVRLSAWNIN